jgi:hypothetical protein
MDEARERGLPCGTASPIAAFLVLADRIGIACRDAYQPDGRAARLKRAGITHRDAVIKLGRRRRRSRGGVLLVLGILVEGSDAFGLSPLGCKQSVLALVRFCRSRLCRGFRRGYIGQRINTATTSPSRTETVRDASSMTGPRSQKLQKLDAMNQGIFGPPQVSFPAFGFDVCYWLAQTILAIQSTRSSGKTRLG